MLQLLWPRSCAGCGRPTPHPLCTRCDPSAILCLPADSLGAQRVWSTGWYDSPLGHAVRQAKVNRDAALARHLALRWATHLAPYLHGLQLSAVVPAPSPPNSLFSRGFSLAALQAEALGPLVNAPVHHALSRNFGPRQATLSRKARLNNLTSRLKLRTPLAGTLLLVDDVTTTGSTLKACFSALKSHDKSIEVFACTIVCKKFQPFLQVQKT